MKDLLSKEYYSYKTSYKVHTLLMKSSAYTPFYKQPPIWTKPPFLQENSCSFHDFSKIPNPLWIREIHTMEIILEIHKTQLTLDNVNTWKIELQALVEEIPEIKLSHWSLLNKTYRNSHSITQALIIFNKFCVLP